MRKEKWIQTKTRLPRPKINNKKPKIQTILREMMDSNYIKGNDVANNDGLFFIYFFLLFKKTKTNFIMPLQNNSCYSHQQFVNLINGP